MFHAASQGCCYAEDPNHRKADTCYMATESSCDTWSRFGCAWTTEATTCEQGITVWLISRFGSIWLFLKICDFKNTVNAGDFKFVKNLKLRWCDLIWFVMFSHVQCCQLRLRYRHQRAAVTQRILTTQITRWRICVMVHRNLTAIDLVHEVVVVGVAIVSQVFMVDY